jgi:hypothetical protein
LCPVVGRKRLVVWAATDHNGSYWRNRTFVTLAAWLRVSDKNSAGITPGSSARCAGIGATTAGLADFGATHK